MNGEFASCKKVLFMKETIFFFFFFLQKNYFLVSGKLFFLIYKNLTVSAFLLPRQILSNGDIPRQKGA